MMILTVVGLFQATILSGCCDTIQAGAVLQIGSLDGPAATIFNQVSAIEIGDDGSLYVLESSASEIRVFSRNGEFVRLMGRRGEGPGELKMPLALGVRGDSVWVFDLPAQKMELFMADGRHVRSVAFRGFTLNLPSVFPLGRFANGRFLIRPTSSHGAATQQHRVERPFFVADVVSRQVDTLVVGHVEYGWMTLTDVTGSNSAFVGTNPLARQDESYVEPSGGFAIMLNQTSVPGGSNEQFELAKMDEVGHVVWRRRFELSFAQDVDAIVSDMVEERLQAAIDHMPDEVRRGFQETVYRDRLRKALESVGERAGLVERMLLDRDGTIWLKPSPVAISSKMSKGEVWYVLDAEGEPLGIVNFPSSMLRLLAVRGGEAFGITLGQFDEQYVTKFAFRLERGKPARQ